MNPEIEMANRENAEQQMQVSNILENIHYQIHMFEAFTHNNLTCDGNVINRRLAKLADQLSDLGWHGNAIPF